MLIDELAKNMQMGKQTDLILLDFSKAFDKVAHEKLLLKLHHYGIRGGEQDSSPTRQFTDTVFEDSSPTEMKTVHRHF